MNETVDRRIEILKILEGRTKPISGTELAKIFDVSRQIIVQDIAILKAEEHPILSTNRGYKLVEENNCRRILKLSHEDEDIEEELNTIVDLGAVVKDVFVNHKVYGTIRVDMNIRSRKDVKNFMATLDSGISRPLKNLTENYHYHTLTAENEDTLDEVELKLKRLGYLLEKSI